MSRFALPLAVCLVSFAAAAAVAFGVTTAQQKAPGGEYRWPWTYGEEWTISQGQENGGSGPLDSHRTGGGLQYALDFASVRQAPVWAAREGTARCEDWRLSGTGLGWVVRVVHGEDSDLYAHADGCYLSSAPGAPVFVPQGRHITYTGTTGTNAGDFGDHLHFQRNTTRTSLTSAPLTIEGLDAIPHRGEELRAVSKTLSAGYGAPPTFAYDPAIAKKAADLGWEMTGSAAPIRFWTPGGGWTGGCVGEERPGWYDCAVLDFEGTVRTGRIQTFSRAPDEGGEAAIFVVAGRDPIFMSRGILGPYTNPWDTEHHDGLYFMGFPLGESRPVGDGLHRMDFENGYAIYDTQQCAERATVFYVWSELLQAHLAITAGAYCDQPVK